MIRLVLAAGLFVGAVFWNRTGQTPPGWPSCVPALAGVTLASATTFGNGSVHVAGAAADLPARVMAQLRAVYAAAGWQESPVTVKLDDFALFTKDSAVAAALTRPTAGGTFLTLAFRP